MLFKIEYIETNMIYLNEVLGHFIRKSVELSQYRKNSLFPAEFIPIHDNQKNSIDTKFKAVFNEIKKLQPAQKKRLKRMYFNHQRIARLCQDNVGIIDFSGLPDDLKKRLKALGDYLYTSALKNVQIKQLAIDKHGDKNSTLNELWTAFRGRNGVVCSFCGIQEYEEQLPDDSKTEWRPAFDHYLPKDQYPLAAVNFKNLVPCCTQCNSKAKGAIDPCQCKATGRKKALFPYNNSDSLGLNFKFVKENIAAKSPWVVTLKKEVDEKHQTWNRVYKIKERVKSRLNAHYVHWIKVECSECLTSNIQQAKVKLGEKAAEHIKLAKEERESIHKAIMMATLATANDDLLASLLETIEPDPQPNNRVDGLNMLNELGFNFCVAS